MTSTLHPIMAAALAPFAPPQSDVHKVIERNQWLRDLTYLEPKERRQLADEVGRQNDVIRLSGGVL